MRVLLVEDEPAAARVLAKGLREHAYAVDVAGDGEAALFQVSTADYDAVILDVMLPITDGLTVCREIRRSGLAVPILMLTARDAVEARIEGLDCGADDYLVKPFDFAEHVWDDHYDPLSNVVDVYIQRLRRKLDAPGADSMIRTRRGEGYQLIERAGGTGDR